MLLRPSATSPLPDRTIHNTGTPFTKTNKNQMKQNKTFTPTLPRVKAVPKTKSCPLPRSQRGFLRVVPHRRLLMPLALAEY